MKRVKTSPKSRTARRLRHTGKTAPRLSARAVSRALGVPSVEGLRTGAVPPSFAAIRAEIEARLTSRGGRPSLEGADRRQKIPLSDADWERLCQLAERFSGDVRPAPSHVASAILHIVLSDLEEAESLLADNANGSTERL